jgi:predicted RecB family endonuclease
MLKSEQDIQKECLKYLKDKGYLAWKQPSQGLRVKGGRRVKARGGSTVGHPDIMALKDGVFYCIEVKKPKGKVDKSQVAWLTWADLMGAKCMVVRSIEEMISKLEQPAGLDDIFVDSFT